MADLMDTVLADFGKSYTVLRPENEVLFAGNLHYDDSTVTTTSHTLTIIKRYETNTSKEEGVSQVFPAYALFKTTVDIVERDLIIVEGQTFIVRELSKRHDNIGGDIGTEAQYVKAELDLYFDGDVTA